jgi:hypothetical protein
MKKQQKRFYHEGDGIIREITVVNSTLRKDKIKKLKKEKNESKSL